MPHALGCAPLPRPGPTQGLGACVVPPAAPLALGLVRAATRTAATRVPPQVCGGSTAGATSPAQRGGGMWLPTVTIPPGSGITSAAVGGPSPPGPRITGMPTAPGRSADEGEEGAAPVRGHAPHQPTRHHVALHQPRRLALHLGTHPQREDCPSWLVVRGCRERPAYKGLTIDGQLSPRTVSKSLLPYHAPCPI